MGRCYISDIALRVTLKSNKKYKKIEKKQLTYVFRFVILKELYKKATEVDFLKNQLSRNQYIKLKKVNHEKNKKSKKKCLTIKKQFDILKSVGKKC